MRIFYDVDTQNDFMNKDGALYVPDAELIKPNLRALTQYAKENFIPVIGSVDKHFGTEEFKSREGELARYGGPFPDHCMDKTRGQLKIYETTLERNRNRMDDSYDNALYLDHQIYHNYPENPIPTLVKEFRTPTELEKDWKELRSGIDQEEIKEAITEIQKVARKENAPKGVYFEKQSYDIFTNPKFSEFLDQSGINQAIVYGVATDYCVRAAVLGMQDKGIQCYVTEDAIKPVNINFEGQVDPKFGDKALEEMTNTGAKIVTTKQVLEGRI